MFTANVAESNAFASEKTSRPLRPLQVPVSVNPSLQACLNTNFMHACSTSVLLSNVGATVFMAVRGRLFYRGATVSMAVRGGLF